MDDVGNTNAQTIKWACLPRATADNQRGAFVLVVTATTV